MRKKPPGRNGHQTDEIIKLYALIHGGKEIKTMKSDNFDPKWKEKNYRTDPLARISNEAKEHGMSYGQYQAYLLARSISHDSRTHTCP